MKHRAIIRQAEPHESGALTDLAMRSKAYWGYSDEFMETCRAELSVSPDDIRDPNFEYFVCEIGKILIGFYAMEKITKKQYELSALFVDPDCIGKGFGKILLDHAKKALLDRNARSLLIQSDPNAEKFYLSAGGVKTGVRESESIPGRFLPEFRIELGSESAA
tara:strand:- start:297 stop:785 length:489 start_codon:yes stop_codon:yes gene_type:complete